MTQLEMDEILWMSYRVAKMALNGDPQEAMLANELIDKLGGEMKMIKLGMQVMERRRLKDVVQASREVH